MADLTPVANTGKMQKDLVLTLGTGAGAKAYQMHVSNVTFTPSGGGQVKWQGGTPDAKLTDASSDVDWVAALTLVQDWDNPDSLANFLLANAGTKVPAMYRPNRASAFTVYSTISLLAPAIGGGVNAFLESTVSMPCTQPTTTPPS